MARPLWSGAISFGLLNIPVELISSRENKAIHFNMLDKRDHARIGYRQYNKSTGKEVTRKDVVKGYEYKPDHFVVVTDKDFERANPKATRTIEIEDFVEFGDLDPLLFDRPYYLLPAKNGEKGYALLRKVMERMKRVAIGKIVLHQKQRLVALIAIHDHLVCEVIRYSHELVDPKEIEDLDHSRKIPEPSKRELEMAERLVKDMTTDWKPKKYKDTYYNDLMKRIQAKIRSGGVIESEEADTDSDSESAPKVLDLMPLLKRSLASSNKKPKKPSSRRNHHGAS